MSTQETIDANKKEADVEANKRKLETVRWVKDDDPASEDISLEIDEEIIGTVMSDKELVEGIHGSTRVVYQFQIVNEPDPRPLYCSTDLRRRMAMHKVGDFLKIRRVRDKKPSSPEYNPTHIFEIYSPKED